MDPAGGEDHAIDRFIVGVDGSKDSRAALRFAAAIAGDCGAKLRVAMAWDLPGGVALLPGHGLRANQERGDAQAASHLRDVIGEELGDDGELAQPVVLRGRPSRTLMRIASNHPGAVLVVGSRGRGGFAEMVLGSTCRALLHDDRVPVIVVHSALAPVPDRIDRIVVGVDGTPGSLSAAAWAAALAGRLGADVIAVHALGGSSADWLLPDVAVHLDQTRTLLDGPWIDPLVAADVPCSTVLVQQDPREAVLRVAREADAGLVVVGRSSGQGLSRWAIGNVAESVVRHATVPVAVVSRPERRS